MGTWNLLATAWDWEPSVVLGCVGLALVYAYLLRFRFSRPAVYAGIGLVVLLLALVSPLDTLGDGYLFSAHMAQHLLLVLVVPPFLLLGIPSSFYRRALSVDALRHLAVLTHPVIAWILGVGMLTIWHLPALYEATLQNPTVHILEHLLFLVTATIFWAPALVPVLEQHLSPLGALVYFMAAGFANTLLAILLAYAPIVLYPTYAHPTDTLGVLTLIRQGWGVDARTDQQIAGLMMWVPGSFPYLIAVFAILARWFSEEEKTSGVVS